MRCNRTYTYSRSTHYIGKLWSGVNSVTGINIVLCINYRYFGSPGFRTAQGFIGDVFFIVDSSESVSTRNYQLEKEFVKSLAREFNVLPGKSRAAYMTYGNFPWLLKRFETHSNPDEFTSIIDRSTAIGGRRRIDKTLEITAREFVNARPNIPKIAILITAGRQSADPEAEPFDSAIRPLRQLGVKTYVVSIGSTPDAQELNPLVEQSKDIFPQNSFNTLKPKKVAKEIISRQGKL